MTKDKAVEKGIEQEYVYIVYEERQLSCDKDYGEDGYMIIWDSDEVGRNITIERLAKRIKKYDKGLYIKLIKHMEEELQLNDFGMADDFLEDIMEFLTNETEGIMYLFYYQNNSCSKEVHKTEESAKKAVEYYTNNHSYNNKHYYTKHRLVVKK